MINILGTSIFIFDDNYFGNLHLRLQRRYTLWRQLCTLWHARFRRHPPSLLTTVTPFGDIHCRFDDSYTVHLHLHVLATPTLVFNYNYTHFGKIHPLSTTFTHFGNVHLGFARQLHILTTSTIVVCTLWQRLPSFF